MFLNLTTSNFKHNIINHQPWSTGLDMHTKLAKKGSDLYSQMGLKLFSLTSNSHDKSDEKNDVLSKEPIIAETYSRPSNDESDALCLFLEYLIHFVVENSRIF